MGGAVSIFLAPLPQHNGLLPKWLFVVGIVAVGNLLQAYRTLHFTSQVYLSPFPDRVKPPAGGCQYSSETTPLHSRTFGTWTLLQGLVRIYAAYNIENAGLYQLAILTNVVAMWHFGTEWFIFGTTRWNMGLAGPVLVSIGSMVWMVLQYGFYVK